MESLYWCRGEKEISTCISDMFEAAKERIFISVPTFDWNVLLGPSGKRKLLITLIQEAVARKVEVCILTGEEFLRTKREDHPPDGCFVRYVSRFGPKIKDETVLWHWDNFVSEKLTDGTLVSLGGKRIFSHNQRYILCDQERALIGPFSLSIQSNLTGPFSEQKIRFMATCSVVKPDEDLLKMIYRNYNSRGVSSLPCNDRFFFGCPSESAQGQEKENPEHALMLRMIMNAKESIVLETRCLDSRENTANKVMKAIAARIAQAIQAGTVDGVRGTEQDPFRVIIFTNVIPAQNLEDMYSTGLLSLTTEYFQKSLSVMGIHDIDKIKERFFLGSVQTNHEVTSFQGTLLIQDGKVALVTSSSIQDKSLAVRRCSELGVLIQEDKKNQIVSILQHKLLQDYLCLLKYDHETLSDLLPLKDYLKLCYQAKGHVVRFRQLSQASMKRFRLLAFCKDKLLGRVF